MIHTMNKQVTYLQSHKHIVRSTEEVMFSSLSVCLSVNRITQKDIYEWLGVKFDRRIGDNPRMNWYNFRGTSMQYWQLESNYRPLNLESNALSSAPMLPKADLYLHIESGSVHWIPWLTVIWMLTILANVLLWGLLLTVLSIDPDQSRDFYPSLLLSWLADKGLGTMKW